MFPFPSEPNADLISEAASSLSKAKKNSYPLSFVLTDFHVMLLYSDRVTAVSLINYQTVYEEYVAEQFGKLIDITKDVQTNTIFAYSVRNIFRFKVTSEHRHVWVLYLEKNEFELAKMYSRDNPAHYDAVLVKQAELFLQQKDFLQSACIYSETQSSFEDVCLKFMQINEYEALLVYLQKRLEKLDAQDKTQITMLVVWIVELFLTQMARLQQSSVTSKMRRFQTEFDDFMKMPKVVECVRNNRTVIYDLMSSHGDNFNLNSLTVVNKDFDTVLNQMINQGKFNDAISVLSRQNQAELYYKYCPMLMETIPRETIDAVIAQARRLKPSSLIPMLICHETEAQRTEAIRYMEFCTRSLGCTDQAIHNYLIKLYAQHKSEKLLTYLELEGIDKTEIHYDVHYALRYN